MDVVILLGWGFWGRVWVWEEREVYATEIIV